MTRFTIFATLFGLEALCLLAISTAQDPICTQQGHYLRYFPGDCSKYYECVHGRPAAQACGWFHRFDETINQCKFYLPGMSVDCSRALHPTTLKLVQVSDKATMSAVHLADEPTCANDKTYNVYYPGDCDKYYKCVNGKKTEESCGWFHRFDEKTSECKFHMWFFGRVDCTRSLNPTKTPPTSPTKGSGSTQKTGTTDTPKGTTKSGTASSTTTGTTGNGKSTTTSKPSPNSQTTKHSGAGSVAVSLVLGILCVLVVIF